MDNYLTPSIFNKEIEYKTFRVDYLINNPFWKSSNSFVKSSENKIRGENTYNCMIDDRMDFSIDKYRVIVKGRSVGSTYESVKHFLKQHPEYIKE